MKPHIPVSVVGHVTKGLVISERTVSRLQSIDLWGTKTERCLRDNVVSHVSFLLWSFQRYGVQNGHEVDIMNS